MKKYEMKEDLNQENLNTLQKWGSNMRDKKERDKLIIDYVRFGDAAAIILLFDEHENMIRGEIAAQVERIKHWEGSTEGMNS